jgi:phasin family protein
MQTAEQLIAAQKSNVATAFVLAATTFEGVEKALELNLQAAKALLGEAAEHAQAVLAAKDAQEVLALQAGLLQPVGEKTAAYSREVCDIAAATGSELSQLVEGRLADLQTSFLAVVDSAVPAGSENAVALMKSSIAAASSVYDSLYKDAKQAAAAAQGDSDAVSTNATDGTQEQPT